MRELEQGLLAVDDIQVVDIGLQLLLLLWRHVASKLVSPAVSQGSDSICDHVLKDSGGTQKWKGHLLMPQNLLR